jgi:hypothetical protein
MHGTHVKRSIAATRTEAIDGHGIIQDVTLPPMGTGDAVRNAHEWFEVNSGWAPPDDETLAEWIADGVCRCPDDCLVAPEAWCEHGLASWALILAALDEA